MDEISESATAVNAWPQSIQTITLLVEDLAAAQQFYQHAFGVPVVFEDDDSTVFKIGGTLVNLLKTTAAGELVAPASVGGRTDGARVVFTIAVDDVDALCAELAARGVALLNGPMDRPWGVRTASFQDPGGHVWEIATQHAVALDDATKEHVYAGTRSNTYSRI